jgi:hypothetical protein
MLKGQTDENRGRFSVAEVNTPAAPDRDRFEPAGEHGEIESFDFDPKKYVFISFVRETNPDLLRAIVRSLLRRRVSVWMYDPTPCRLTVGEDRAVQSQEEDKRERPNAHWTELVTDAMKGASAALLLIGQRSLENQLFEIELAIEKGCYHAIRIDDVPDTQVHEKLRAGINRQLDVGVLQPDVVAKAVERLADELAKDVLGEDFKPVVTRTAPIKPKGVIADGRLGLVAAAALVVALGGAAAVWWPKPTPQPAIDAVDAVDPTLIPVAGKRLALVITQANYNGRTIRRVEKAVEEGGYVLRALRELKFDITPVINEDKAGLEEALDAFREKLKAAGHDAVAFIYYTGHGIQHPQHPDNFLLGTDTELKTAADIETYGVNLTSQRDLFHAVGARGVFMVFDACRNIPPDFKDALAPKSYEPPVKGMVRMKAPVGMLVAYATEEGDVAQEGAYAPILAEELLRPGQSIEQIFLRTKNRVADKSGRAQLPWNDSKIYENLCFSCPPPGTPS